MVESFECVTMHRLANPKFKATEPLKLGLNHNKITNIFSGDPPYTRTKYRNFESVISHDFAIIGSLVVVALSHLFIKYRVP